ncbi:MAG TPA: hypothetical protein VM889_09715 [Candidatus Thermoplasmatota archaeon]|nr:hypothetical protein [Candidatus Thermoplasmatota archaeon]
MRLLSRPRVAASIALERDHVRVALPPAARALALKRDILVPYSTIRESIATDAPWPGIFAFRVGTHVPGVVCLGRFWIDGEKRFYAFTKGDRVLTLALDGHDFDAIVVGAPDADGLASAVRTKLRSTS